MTTPADGGPEDRRKDATQALLHLTAGLMEEAFEALGEGTILATMPPYLERFGKDNARYLQKHFLDCDASVGALSALSALNTVSRVTGTPFSIEEATQDRAVKRLHACEFLEAFEDRGLFPRAMICQLHRSVYQGSVNGLLEDPEREGYDVELRSRILFGDAHCDFEVQSRRERPGAPDRDARPRPDAPLQDTQGLRLHFYAYLLASFVDYLSTMLPSEAVEPIMRTRARQVGHGLQPTLAAITEADGPTAWLHEALTSGGRQVETDGEETVVTACPLAAALRQATHHHEADQMRKARQHGCTMCHGLVEGIVDAACPGTRVVGQDSLVQGDDACRFRTEGT